MAEIGLMIHADAGDDRKQRQDHIGGIEPAAQAGFEDYEIDLRLGEPEQSKSCGKFEVGDLLVAEHSADPPAQFRECGFVDVLIADSNPFPDTAQMGGCVHPDAVTGPAEHLGQGSANRPLAVRPGYMDKPQTLLRPADPVQE
ncbi:MAG: hypothetical protein ACD_75C02462G0001 [uncultured bacterium]|nr:MAG: hypothetical protein ACD_75C02462G0001 [uncultured bacterium]